MQTAASVAIDVVQLLSWAFIIIGSAFVSVLVWIGLGVFKRLDGIDAEQRNIKLLIAADINKLTELYHELDKRLIKLEMAPPRLSRASDPPQ